MGFEWQEVKKEILRKIVAFNIAIRKFYRKTKKKTRRAYVKFLVFKRDTIRKIDKAYDKLFGDGTISVEEHPMYRKIRRRVLEKYGYSHIRHIRYNPALEEYEVYITPEDEEYGFYVYTMVDGEISRSTYEDYSVTSEMRKQIERSIDFPERRHRIIVGTFKNDNKDITIANAGAVDENTEYDIKIAFPSIYLQDDSNINKVFRGVNKALGEYDISGMCEVAFLSTEQLLQLEDDICDFPWIDEVIEEDMESVYSLRIPIEKGNVHILRDDFMNLANTAREENGIKW